MSDTPRTDTAAIGFARLLVEHGTPDKPEFKTTELVPAAFARILERELTEARAIAERETRAVMHYSQAAARAEGAPQWIPVAERLPEPDANVLCLVGAGFFPVRPFLYAPTELYQDRPWKDSSGSRPYGHFITHWMPLPSGPKSDLKDK